MSRKDYHAIASAIYQTRKAVDVSNQGALTYLENTLAAILAGNNPRFDRDRFILACNTGSK